jgi:hypothetical protein
MLVLRRTALASKISCALYFVVVILNSYSNFYAGKVTVINKYCNSKMSFQTISNDMPQNFSLTNFFQTENLNDRVQQIADNAEMTAADMKIQEQLMASDKRYKGFRE